MVPADQGSFDPADPMAPRRDAPIFRMQQAAPRPEPVAEAAPAQTGRDPAAPRIQRVAEVSNTGERPPQQGARYYSVHRAAGRQPDATAMPTSVYLDHAPLNLTDTPTSADLAEPPAAPAVTRTVNGRAQVVTPNEDPSLP